MRIKYLHIKYIIIIIKINIKMSSSYDVFFYRDDFLSHFFFYKIYKKNNTIKK